MRWPITESGSVDAMVPQLSRQSHGDCVFGHRTGRGSRSMDLTHSRRVFWLAGSTSNLGTYRYRNCLSGGVSCEGAAPPAAACTDNHRPSIAQPFQERSFLLTVSREHVFHSSGQRNAAESETFH